MCIDDWVYFLRCRANSRRCLRRRLAFGYVARCCSRRNARLSCGADNGGRNTFPHTISPFTPFNSVLLRSGAFRFLKPDCVARLLSNNRKRLLLSSFEVLQQPLCFFFRLRYRVPFSGQEVFLYTCGRNQDHWGGIHRQYRHRHPLCRKALNRQRTRLFCLRNRQHPDRSF